MVDQRSPVENILEEKGTSTNRWLSDPKDKSGQIEAVFQLDKSCRISFIDIGTTWCANIELQVGRSTWAAGVAYHMYIPTVSLMTPAECKVGKSHDKTRMFAKDDFSAEAVTESWDRIRVICRQPFRKDLQFGLFFLRVGTSELGDRGNVRSTPPTPITPGPDRRSGEEAGRVWRDPGSGHKVSGGKHAQNTPLSRTERMVIAAAGRSGSVTPRSRELLDREGGRKVTRAEDGDGMRAIYSRFENEVVKFLRAQNITSADLDSNLSIAELRRRFLTQHQSELTTKERKYFARITKRFMFAKFGDVSGKAVSPVDSRRSISQNNYRPGNDDQCIVIDVESNDRLSPNRRGVASSDRSNTHETKHGMKTADSFKLNETKYIPQSFERGNEKRELGSSSHDNSFLNENELNSVRGDLSRGSRTRKHRKDNSIIGSSEVISLLSPEKCQDANSGRNNDADENAEFGSRRGNIKHSNHETKNTLDAFKSVDNSCIRNNVPNNAYGFDGDVNKGGNDIVSRDDSDDELPDLDSVFSLMQSSVVHSSASKRKSSLANSAKRLKATHIPASPAAAPGGPLYTGLQMVTCNTCGKQVPQQNILLHENRCTRSAASPAHRPVVVADRMESCPICDDIFPLSELNAHANSCADRICV